MSKVTFEVHGKPYGKGRPRFRNAGKYVQTYTPIQTVSFENLVKLEYTNQAGAVFFEGELSVEIEAVYPIPASGVSKAKRRMMLAGELHPTVKPDCDNIAKTILDALNEVAFRDDKQVVSLTVRKTYGEIARTVVTISDAKEGDPLCI